MPPRRELNQRFHGHLKRTRKIRTIGVSLLVVCLLVGTGFAFEMIAPPDSIVRANLITKITAISGAFAPLRNISSRASGQLAAVPSLPWLDAAGDTLFNILCPFFGSCPRAQNPSENVNSQHATYQPNVKPPVPTPSPAVPSAATTNARVVSGSPAPTTVINQPVIERVAETVRTVEAGFNASYVDERVSLLRDTLLQRMAAMENANATSFRSVSPSSSNVAASSIIGTIGNAINSAVGTILDLTATTMVVTNATTTNLVVTGSASLPATSVTGDLTVSGTLTAGALAVSGVSSGGAVTAPYFTATSTSQSSDFQQLTATHATTTSLFVNTALFNGASIGATATSSFSSAGALSMGGHLSFGTDNTFDFGASGANRARNAYIGGFVTAAGSLRTPGYLELGNTSHIYSAGQGIIGLYDQATEATFNRLQLGGTTSAFPSIKRNGAGIDFRLADDSAYANIAAAGLTLSSALGISSGGTATTTFYNGGVLFSDGTKLTQSGAAANFFWDETNKRLGIGTAAPGTTLVVSGTDTRTTGIESLSPAITTVNKATGIGTYSGTLFQNFGTAQNLGFIGTRVTDGANSGLGDLIFATRPSNSNTTLTEYMTLQAGGNVGIGTTTPWAKLSVTNTGTGPSFVVEDSTSPDSTPFIVTASGDVGIGTASPVGLLDVSGVSGTSINISTPFTASAYGDLVFTSPSVSTYNARIRANVPGDGTRNLQFITAKDAAEGVAMTILGTGNVGIGTTNPGAKLDVAGAVKFSASSELPNGPAVLNNSDGLLLVAGTTAGVRINNQTNGAELLRVTNDGNLGIASTTPYAKLSVTNTGSGPSFVVEDSTSPDTTPFIIDVSGNVGIGTASPGTKLEVSGTSNDTIGGTNAFLIAAGHATNAVHIGAIFSAPYATYIQSGAQTQSATTYPLALNPIGGNVGVATTSPWRTLSVTGTVGFDGLTGATGAGSLCLDSNKQVVYNSASDNCLSSTRATKHDINPLVVDALSQVLALQPVSFVYNDGDGRTRFGFIAEDTAAVDPHLVTYDASSTVSGIDDRSIIAVLVGAIKDLWAKVVALVQSDERQNAEIERLKARVDQLETAAGASALGDRETPAASSAREANPDTDTAINTIPSEATSTPEAANEDPPVADEQVAQEADIEPEVEAPPEPVLEPANDNQPVEELPATGTQ
jgi:hypothetical protein